MEYVAFRKPSNNSKKMTCFDISYILLSYICNLRKFGYQTRVNAKKMIRKGSKKTVWMAPRKVTAVRLPPPSQVPAILPAVLVAAVGLVHVRARTWLVERVLPLLVSLPSPLVKIASLFTRPGFFRLGRRLHRGFG